MKTTLIQHGTDLSRSKGYRGMAMEGSIARWYATTTEKEPSRHKLLLELAKQTVAPGSHVLEIAPGPGYSCIELARLREYAVSGLDISQSFVEIARAKAAQAGVEVDFRLGNAAAMPFADKTFDFLFCQAAFKNFAQPVKAIAEMHRVLRPGGKAVIVDLRQDASREEIRRHVQVMGLSRLNTLLTLAIFRLCLLRKAHTLDRMRAFIAQTPFSQCSALCAKSGIGFQVWLTKDPAPW